MKRFPRTIALILLAAAVALTAFPASVFAVERALTTEFTVNTYKIENVPATSKITKNVTPTFNIELRRNSNDPYEGDGNIQIVHGVDSFYDASGTLFVEPSMTYDPVRDVYTATIPGIIYSGSGNTLEFTILTPTKYQTITLHISQCEEYVEPIPNAPVEYTPNPTPMPRAVFSTNEITELLAPDTTAVITVHIHNTGTTAMQNPILNVSTSESLILTGGQISYPMLDIGAGKRVDVEIPVRTTKTITNQTQSIELSLSFDYLTAGELQRGETSGRVLIPVQPSEEPQKEPEPEKETPIDKPVPLVILTDYSYGGESLAAGTDTELNFTFKNTSRELRIENLMLTVSMSSDLRFNGATNTYYFDSMSAGTSRTLTIPIKVAQVINSTDADVRLTFKYEYVENKTRKENVIDLTVSIPVYQPDRMEFGEPNIPYVGMVGEEVSLTIDYVNKGRTGISNMEAEIYGDLYAWNSHQRVGNVESGKSGTLAFAFTPTNEGDNTVTIVVTYEDSNGDLKERTFETIVTAMPYEEPWYPTEPDFPIEPEKKPFPWWIAGAAAALALLIFFIVRGKKKKKAKAEEERKMLENWENEDEK